MNLSGNCLIRLAREALNQEKRICTSDKEPTIASVLPRLLVVCDDYALNTVSISCTHTPKLLPPPSTTWLIGDTLKGMIRVRTKGSSGGQKGLQSIIDTVC
jgi:hypothetical protein